MKRAADGGSASPHRIGVFGGTFDPPHEGHVSAARDVADALGLDLVLWLVARRSPHKPDQLLTADELRLKMVREATAADPRFQVDDSELRRPPPSYTVDTLEELRTRYPAALLYLIIGVDQFRAFEAWHEPDRVRELAALAVMDREGKPVAELTTEAVAVGSMPQPSHTPPDVGPLPIVGVPVRRIDVSSTEVRARAAAGRPLEGLVPREVRRIIEREGLYRTPAA